MNYVMNNVKKVSAILLVGLASFHSFAQEGENLISNGSFEATDGKVKKLGGIVSSTGWESPTGVAPDLFSPNKLQDINAPENIYGKEEPKEGSNYAGIITYSPDKTKKIQRSYLMIRLDTPLKKGMRYCVKFNASMAEASKYASNNLGALFTSKPLSKEGREILNLKELKEESAHILPNNNDLHVISQTFNWEQICGTYEAKGGEKYITIGNFYQNDQTKYENNKKTKDLKTPQIVAAYYYIDDVSVILLGKEQACDCLVPEETNEYSTTVYQKEVIVNDKMTVNQKIEAQQLYFAFGSATLSPSAAQSLDFIVQLIKANAELKLEINGFSDSEEDKVGIEKPNFAEMDFKRVNAIMAYLIEKGIPESRLIASPQGSQIQSEAISEYDDNDLKMAKNRRATFKVR